jgi:DNA-binding LacI/PurR family transcriptional regulator
MTATRGGTAPGSSPRRVRASVTLGEVAAAAQVSVATAARALGDYGSVSPATRDRVHAAAQRLGYRANHLARSMVTGSTRTLGVVVSDIENPFFSNALRGISDVAGAAGYEVVIVNTDEDPEIERDAVRTLLERRVDGLVVSPAVGAEPAHLQRALAGGAPVVLLDRLVLGVPGDSVGIDNRDAARSATRRLVLEGHVRIGLVTGDSADSHPGLARVVGEGVETAFGGTTGLRVAGYRDALLEAGLPLDPALLAADGLRPEDAARATRRLLALPDPPTALIGLDSLLTLGVLQALEELRLRWPDDVSVIGFDDADWTEAVSPPLTVLAQPVQDIGRTACELLLRRLRGHDGRPEHRWLPTCLVERASVGPPPRR